MEDKKNLNKPFAVMMAFTMSLGLTPTSVFGIGANDIVKDGTYQSTQRVLRTQEDDENEEEWGEYDITVNLQVENGKFANINVTTGNDYDSESKSYFDKAYSKSKGFKTLIEGKDATTATIEQWDTVSGATRTSTAIKTAALKALENAETVAKIDLEALSSEILKAEALVEKDYTVESWAVLKANLASAKAVYQNPESQAIVNDALAKLQSAITELEKAAQYKYVYAGLSWAEYWANEDVYLVEGSSLTAGSNQTDKRGELDKGAFDTVSRATTNHGLHRGSYQCNAVIYDTDGKTYEISYWTSKNDAVLTNGNTINFDKGVITYTQDGVEKTATMDHYEVKGIKYVPVKVKAEDYDDFCKQYAVVENDGTVIGGFSENELVAYSNSANVTETTNGLKTASKNNDGSFTFGARKTGTDSGLKDKSQLKAANIEAEVKEASGSYGEFLRVDLTGDGYGDLGSRMYAVRWDYYGDDSSYSNCLTSYGTKFAADNWMHKSMGIQLGLTNSLRCQLPSGTDGTGYWALTVYAMGYEDYTVKFQATDENIVKEDIVTEALEAAINTASNLVESDYTVESWAILQEKLTVAREVLEAKESQVEIIKAANELLDAMNSLEKISPYVYGTVDLSYADFYYGELNDIEASSTMDLTAADKVTASNYRKDGMYDAVSSATTTKSTKFGATYYTQSDSGVEIEGLKDVNIAVPTSLYNEAKEAIKEGKGCNNKLLTIIENMTVTDTIPAEYKVLNGDGTLGAMVSETVVDNEATAQIATNTTWGHYQIDVESDYLPTSDNMEGVVIETSDGKKYGMEHLENLWLRSGEIAFAVKDGFKVPQGNAIDYLRHEELQGKTITKITYLIKDAPDLVINTNLLCKKLLDEEYQAAGKDAVYEDGVNVAMSIKAPEGSSYKLTEVSYKGNSLVAGTDYKYENNVLTVYKTAATGIGQYTLTYTDELYEDMTANVILTAGYNEGDVKLVNNKLVLPEGLDVTTYLSSISGISVNGKALRGSNLATVVFNEDGTINFDAKVSFHGNTTVVFPDAGTEYELDVQSIGYPSVSGIVTSPEKYVYGTVDLPYADFYYGELNDIEASSTMNLAAIDKVTTSNYRKDGMYDAVSSATTTKSTKFGATYYTQSDSGVEIEGLKDVNIAVPTSLYNEAKEAIKEGKGCNNKLLTIIENMTVTDTIPAEYKVLNGDGTLGAMVSETVVDNEATAQIATNTTWGHYQIDVESDYLPTSDNMEGVVIETSDGKKYGMEHLENLWLRSGEIAFAVKDGFKVPQGNAIDYLRHEELQGKTITKITYLIKDAPDLVINTNLLCKKLLDEEYQAAGKDAVYEDGVNVAMSIKAPEGSSYKLTEVSYKGNSLVAGTDYKYENNVLTVYKTAATGIGQYTLTYTDELYEDMTANVILTAGYNEGDVKLVNNKLVLPEGLDVATYLSSISGISVNGKALRGSNLGTVVFNEDGSINFDAEVSFHGNTTVVFPDAGTEYELDVQSIGYPSVSGIVVSLKDEPVDEIDTAALQSIIEKAEALKETDYTADSWSTLQIVLDEAKTILETKESQESVDNIAKALQSAIDALAKADNSDDLPSSDVTNSGNSSAPSPDNSGNKTDSNDLKTGDPASIWGWMSLAISSFGASGLTWKVRKSKRNEEK